MPSRQDLPSKLTKARQQLQKAQSRVAALEAQLWEGTPNLADLTSSEDRYHRTLDTMLEGCQLIGFDWRYLYVNDAAARHGQYTKDELLGYTMMECYPGIEKTALFAVLQRCMEMRQIERIENEFIYPDGTSAWFELRVQPVPEGIFILSLDITAHKQAEENIRKLHRTLGVLSDINQIIVRVRHLPSLFEKACEIAVEKGTFRMAWIGLFHPKTGRIDPATSAGIAANDLEKLISTLNTPPLVTALRGGARLICNDIQTDPRWRLWREEALRLGCRATVALPLLVAGEIRGSFNLCADEIDFFDEQEMRLMDEMVGDIAFAIEVAEQDEQRQQAEASVKRYAARMEILHQIDRGIINATSTKAIIEVALQHMRRLIPCQRANVALLDVAKGGGVIFAVDYDGDPALGQGLRIPIGRDFFDGYDARHMKIIPDLRVLQETNPHFQQAVKEGLRCGINVLLMDRDQPIGTLGLFASTPDFFTAEHQEILSEVGSQLAIAIRQMQLSEQLAQYTTSLEQKVAERTADLQAALGRVEAILHNSPDAILLVDADLTVQQTNSSFNTLFGAEADAYLGQSLLTLLHPDDVHALGNLRQIVAAQQNGNQLEVRAIRKDGTTFNAELNTGLIKGDGLVCIIRDITERKRAEEALQTKMAEERQFQLYLKALHEIIIELTGIDQLDTFYQRAVELGRERLGFERLAMFLYDAQDDSAVGTYGTDIEGKLVDERGVRFTPDPNGIMQRSFEQVERFYFNAATTLYHDAVPVGSGWNVAAVLWNGSRSLGWFVADNLLRHGPAAKPLLDTLGLYALSVGTLLAQKQTQLALRESVALYRLLAENLADVIMTFSLDRQITYMSASCEKLLGYLPEEVEGRYHSEFIHPEDYGHVIARTRQAVVAKDDSYTNQFRLRHKAGHYIWYEVRTRVVWERETGNIVQFVSVLRDITERKQAEDALRASEEKYRSLVETMRGGLAVFDTEFRVTYVNDRFCELLGYAREEVIGKQPLRFVDAADIPLVQAHLARRQTGESTSYEIPIRHKDGHQVYLLMSGSPLLDQQGKYNGSIVVATDITIQKQAEATLRHALAKEKELGDLKTRFVSMASHEFRTPLATILAVVETLSIYRRKLSEEQIDQRFDKIKDQVGHLKDIMEDVLLLARMQARRVEFQPVQVDLDVLVRSVLDEFQSLAESAHRLEYTVSDGGYEVRLDRKLMRQLISNLVSNAIKYSLAETVVRIQLDCTDAAVILTIRDEGIGIPEADLPHLFEPFHRAANVGTISGTGLGLVIAREAVELHGGAITVASQPGIGTTFCVRIPTAAGEAQQRDADPGQ